MFVNLQKITTATTSRRSNILVNSHEIMLIEVDQFHDKEYNTFYDATRVEIAGHQAVYTPSTFADINSVMPIIDCRGGGPAIDFTYPESYPPMIRCNAIFNSSRSSLEDYAFNPRFLIYAEVVSFTDTITKARDEGLLLVFRSATPRRVLTDLLYSQLVTLLSAQTIPVSLPP